MEVRQRLSSLANSAIVSSSISSSCIWISQKKKPSWANHGRLELEMTKAGYLAINRPLKRQTPRRAGLQLIEDARSRALYYGQLISNVKY
jgi:hypothetical protein